MIEPNFGGLGSSTRSSENQCPPTKHNYNNGVEEMDDGDEMMKQEPNMKQPVRHKE